MIGGGGGKDKERDVEDKEAEKRREKYQKENEISAGEWKREVDVYGHTPIWFVLPILFPVIGGIIMYFVTRKQNPKMAKAGLIVGIAMFFGWWFLIFG